MMKFIKRLLAAFKSPPCDIVSGYVNIYERHIGNIWRSRAECDSVTMGKRLACKRFNIAYKKGELDE